MRYEEPNYTLAILDTATGTVRNRLELSFAGSVDISPDRAAAGTLVAEAAVQRAQTFLSTGD